MIKEIYANMNKLALDPNVYIIVTLRRRGHSEDEIAVMKAIVDSLDKDGQRRLAEIVAMEDEDIIERLVKTLPAIRESIAKGGEKTPADLIEGAFKDFE
jgi:hypothetical protein